MSSNSASAMILPPDHRSYTAPAGSPSISAMVRPDPVSSSDILVTMPECSDMAKPDDSVVVTLQVVQQATMLRPCVLTCLRSTAQAVSWHTPQSARDSRCCRGVAECNDRHTSACQGTCVAQNARCRPQFKIQNSKFKSRPEWGFSEPSHLDAFRRKHRHLGPLAFDCIVGC